MSGFFGFFPGFMLWPFWVFFFCSFIFGIFSSLTFSTKLGVFPPGLLYVLKENRAVLGEVPAMEKGLWTIDN